MNTVTIQHVLLPVTDLEKSRAFYGELLGLREKYRPTFEYAGVWYELGGGQELHLVVYPHCTLRGAKKLDDCDVHFALRVMDFAGYLERLRLHGRSEEAPDDDALKMMVRMRSSRGYAQIYVLDPDRHVIELNSVLPEEG